MKNITIIGCGYVGRGNAEFLSKNFDVLVYDINPEVLCKVKVPVTTDRKKAYVDADVVFLCLPTDSKEGRLDTALLQNEIFYIKNVRPDVMIVIRSTCPVGFTEMMILETGMNIVFYPEFLREGREVEDCANPDRIVIGTARFQSFPFIKGPAPILVTGPSEAEAIKLFSNTYLALRVAYFNELDSYCIEKDLDSKDVVKGVCMDSRIGDYYNNPSFGFGGYCLPKDSQELQFQVRHNVLINSIPDSNLMRKNYIATMIKKYANKKVGVYKLAMKSGSDNSRESAVVDVIKLLQRDDILIYNEDETCTLEELFKCDLIICNRYEDELKEFTGDIFTRDIYRRD